MVFSMKKFMKSCAIIAAILIGVGLLMSLLGGAAAGGRLVSDVVKSATGGLVEVRLTDGEFGIFIDDEDIWDGVAWKHIDKNIVINEDEEEVDIKVDFDSAYDIFQGDVEKYEITKDVIDLKIMAGGCRLRMVPSGDDSFYAEAEDIEKFQCYAEDNCLYVKTSQDVSTWNGITWNGSDSGVIVLHVPEGFVFDNVDMKLGAGQLIVENVNANSVEMEVGAGQIEVNTLQADNCDIEVGLGEVTVTDARVNNVDAEVGMGQIEMLLAGSEEDYDYKVSVAAGSVTIGSTEYSGVGQKKTINNEADRMVNLDCGMGEIQVEFDN